MSIKCLCIYCPRHPLHNIREQLSPVYTGYGGERIFLEFLEKFGRDVDCFKPMSFCEEEIGVDPDDLDWGVVAYGDGVSVSYAVGCSYEIWANCDNETYKG